MNSIIVILLHFAIYAFPIFFITLFKPKYQLYFSYAYLGAVFCLTKIFNSLYSLQLSKNFLLNGGDIAYSALMFAAIFLVLTHPEPENVRNLINFIFILNLFISLLFILLNGVFASNVNVIYLDYSEMIVEFSYKSVLYSYLLISGELLLLLFTFRLFFQKKKHNLLLSGVITIIFIIIMILDGILYPVGINILFSGSNLSIKYGIYAKLIFGGGFGLLLFIYLNLFPSKLEKFTSIQFSFIRYFLPPKRKSLLKKYEDAKKEINELRTILPICSKCKKIRTDEGYWEQLEEYLAKHNDVYFSHSYCPSCAKEIMDEIDKEK